MSEDSHDETLRIKLLMSVTPQLQLSYSTRSTDYRVS